MKAISYILLISFFSLTITPVSIMVLRKLKAQSEMKCSLAGENETCDMNDMECCPGMCNPTQCCFCCFICTVDHKKFEIKIFESDSNKHNSDDQYDLSDFSSDCWQPPKMV